MAARDGGRSNDSHCSSRILRVAILKVYSDLIDGAEAPGARCRCARAVARVDEERVVPRGEQRYLGRVRARPMRAGGRKGVRAGPCKSADTARFE